MHRSPRRTFTGLVNRHHRGLDDDSCSSYYCPIARCIPKDNLQQPMDLLAVTFNHALHFFWNRLVEKKLSNNALPVNVRCNFVADDNRIVTIGRRGHAQYQTVFSDHITPVQTMNKKLHRSRGHALFKWLGSSPRLDEFQRSPDLDAHQLPTLGNLLLPQIVNVLPALLQRSFD